MRIFLQSMHNIELQLLPELQAIMWVLQKSPKHTNKKTNLAVLKMFILLFKILTIGNFKALKESKKMEL